MAFTHSKPVAALMEIDGLTPSNSEFPATPQELADLLATAGSEGKAVAPIGGCTSLALGNAPERLDLAISTENISGVISYEPTDLTLSVWAGSRFGEVNALLADHGQTLPLDVAHPDQATIGGLIATGLAGPRRSGSPTFRDLLIGISVGHSSGTVTKAGGMVVKNVTGFDLMRVYLGSLGTLGIIVSANFKVLPLGRRDLTVLKSFSTQSDAVVAALKIRDGRARPVALEVFQSNDGSSVAARLEGRESTVQLLSEEVAQILGGSADIFDGDASRSWWQSFTDTESATSNGQDAVIRCSSRPRQGHQLFVDVSSEIRESAGVARHLSWSPALGTITCRVSFPESRDATVTFVGLQKRFFEIADNVLVLAAPAEWKARIDVWGATPETIDIMRALKEQFDPGRVLNPGRFAGSI
jgi:glycolate oxidase FAD binding subunit